MRCGESDGKSSPPTIETGGVIPQFEEDLFHLERSRECFDQNGSPDGVVGNSEIGLREEEDVVPETGLKVVFHLWKVEIGTGAALDEFMGIVVKVEREIEQRGRQGSIVNRHAGLVQVPTSRSVGSVNKHRLREIGVTYRTKRTAGFSTSLYGFPPDTKSTWRLTASRRLTCPLSMFANVGALESMPSIGRMKRRSVDETNPRSQP